MGKEENNLYFAHFVFRRDITPTSLITRILETYILLWSYFCILKLKQIIKTMKQRFVSLCAAAIAISFAACNNDSTESSTSDSTTTTATSTPTTTTSEGNYAAMADSVERNSQQGYYLNPKTGKAYSNLKVDRTTGRITDESGEPVWRYVDRRNWWVYGDDNYDDSIYNWNQVGEAKMEGEKLTYKSDDDKWVDYDTKWKVSDDGMKQKMTTSDGDKIKVKTDEEGNTKIKVNGEKTKVDKDGKVIKD
jgi:hypothetical protein